MLSFEEKLEICSTYAQLERRNVSLGRVNFAYEESAYDKKTVVYHLHPNGNGYVYAGLLKGESTDDKGFVSIRDASEEGLRDLISRSIASLTRTEQEQAPASKPSETHPTTPDYPQQWSGPDSQKLTLKFEDDLWYIYTGANLEVAFETMEEVLEYMAEEGFSPVL